MTWISDGGKNAVSLGIHNAGAVPTVRQTRTPGIPCQNTNQSSYSLKARQSVGIRVENTAHGAVPVVVCNYCGTRIHAAKDGNYEWRGVSSTVGQRMAVYFLHKWCSPAHEAEHGIVLDSIEPAVMLPQLAEHLQLDWDEASVYDEILDDL
jgi:hypothetical protein